MMTDITELSDMPARSAQRMLIEQHDALEAQAKRIAGLEYEARLFDEALWNAHARIAELEALLKDCADDLEAEVDARYGENAKKCMPHRYERDMAPVVAARAALNGEKK
jgi:hypothetical protein